MFLEHYHSSSCHIVHQHIITLHHASIQCSTSALMLLLKATISCLKRNYFTSRHSRQVKRTPHCLLPFNMHPFHGICMEEPCLTPIPSSRPYNTLQQTDPDLQQTDSDLIRNNAKFYIQPICIITYILLQYISQIFYFIFPLYT